MEKIENFIADHIANTKTILEDTLTHIKNSYPHEELIENFLLPAKNIVTKGKFIRSRMCILGALYSSNGVINKNSDKNISQICSALELYHLSALIHDDIIDNTQTRRSLPASHIFFHSKENKYYGKNTSILLGDLLLSKSFENLQKIDLTDINKYKNILTYFSQITQEVSIGQYYDLYASTEKPNKNLTLDKNLINSILISKTAHYTVTKPFILGTKLFSEKNIDKIKEALMFWGIAFQMKDDELGVFGNPNITGKPASTDLLEEKKTLLLAYTLDSLSYNERKTLLDNLSILKDTSEIKKNENIEKIKNQIIKSGAFEKHTEQMQLYYSKGREILEDIEMDTNLKKYISDFASSLITRKK